MEHTIVPKCWHIKFRHQGVTQMKESTFKTGLQFATKCSNVYLLFNYTFSFRICRSCFLYNVAA